MGATRPASGIEKGENKLCEISSCLFFRRETRLLKNAPMLGKGNCYKYFRISLKMSSFTSKNTL